MWMVAGVLTLVVMVGVGGGILYAATSSSTGVVNACVNTAGQPRIVTSASECKKSEKPLSWNQQGPPGVGAQAWFKSAGMGDTHISLPAHPDNNAPEDPQVMLANLPEPPSGGGYLMSATFGLMNNGPRDAGLICAVDDQSQQQLFVPMNDQTPQEFGGVLNGVFSSNTRTYTITGVVQHGGNVGLKCWINKWPQQDAVPAQPAPAVEIWSALVTAQRIDQLTDQS